MKKWFVGFVLVVVLASLFVAVSVSAQTTNAWTGSYFNNADLQGEPTLTRIDANIDFSWGNVSPAPNIPADNFSARWTRWLYMDAAGAWTFTTTTDDGVRLYIDDNLVIDGWSDQSLRTRTVTLNLTQSYHLVRMEFVERTGNAQAHLQISSAAFPDWRGEYFSNPDLVGNPVFMRNDSAINFNFGVAGPGGGIPGTNFSVRWTGNPYFESGTYRFTATADDGVRLWVDGKRVIDEWHDQTPTPRNADVTLTAGNHAIKLEYFQHGSNASAILKWTSIGNAEIWRGDYFDNPNLTGNPAFSRDDANIDFDWSTQPPGSGVKATNWSARWTTRKTVLAAGYYSVLAQADDGVRVWLDNTLVIDQWHDSSPTLYSALVFLAAGTHDWKIEYYQRAGTASLHVLIAAGGAPASSSTISMSDVIVDTTSAYFLKGGVATWGSVANGRNGTASTLLNETFAQAQGAWMRWYAPVPRPGMYEVFVWIPAGAATTRNALYSIVHGGDFDTRVVSQIFYLNQWVSLGTYYFSATGDEYVSLSNVTYEPQQSTTIVIDAVKFAPR